MKKKVLIIGTLLLTLIAGTASADARKNVVVNGSTVLFDQDPIVKNGVTLVQFKPVFNSLGISIDWDQKKKQITGAKGGSRIVLNVGSKKAYVNGALVKLDVEPQIIKGSVFVPLRFISETTGATLNIEGNVIQIHSGDETFHSNQPSVPQVNEKSSQNKQQSWNSEEDRADYLNRKFPSIAYKGETFDTDMKAFLFDSGFAVDLRFKDVDEYHQILNGTKDDKSLPFKITKDIANEIHRTFGENDFNIMISLVLESPVYPEGIDTDEIYALQGGGYEVRMGTFGVGYQYTDGTAFVALFDPNKVNDPLIIYTTQL